MLNGAEATRTFRKRLRKCEKQNVNGAAGLQYGLLKVLTPRLCYIALQKIGMGSTCVRVLAINKCIQMSVRTKKGKTVAYIQ